MSSRSLFDQNLVSTTLVATLVGCRNGPKSYHVPDLLVVVLKMDLSRTIPYFACFLVINHDPAYFSRSLLGKMYHYVENYVTGPN